MQGRNKFHAIQSTSSCGRSFASKGERDCFEMLKLMEKAGEIHSIECQVTSDLTSGIKHKTDFKVWDNKTDAPLWIEYKGFVDQRWRDIKKLWKHFGPGRLKVYAGYGLRMKVIDEIIPEIKKNNGQIL